MPDSDYPRNSDNLGLYEQSGDEYYDIGIVNSNLEKVDNAFGRNNIVMKLSNVVSFPGSGYANSGITTNHRVVNMVLSNNAAQRSNWSYTIASGKITLTGTVSEATDITLFLAEFYGTNTSATQTLPAMATVADVNALLPQSSFTQIAGQRFHFTTTNQFVTGSEFTLEHPSIVIAYQTYNNAPPKNISIHTSNASQSPVNCMAVGVPTYDSTAFISAVLPARTSPNYYCLWGASAADSGSGNDWIIKACAL